MGFVGVVRCCYYGKIYMQLIKHGWPKITTGHRDLGGAVDYSSLKLLIDKFCFLSTVLILFFFHFFVNIKNIYLVSVVHNNP